MTEKSLHNLVSELAGLTANVPHLIANLANTAAFLFEKLDNVNWAGFYVLEGGRLVLGPFCGRPACIEIPVGKGVCGTAVSEDCTQLVPDVHLFPGHIACDSASRSEIVIPLHLDGSIWGVLDIDSPVKGRFGTQDRLLLENLAQVIEDFLKTSG